MPIITIKPSGKTVEMPVGASLAAAVIAAGEPMVLKCEGKGECDSCHIFVQ
ncbi:2Fe-2S iron-sulfur cluster-binding protein, partial [Acidithiobacillus sp.]